MKKIFNQKLDLNSSQIQRLTAEEAKKVVGGSNEYDIAADKLTLGTWPPTTIHWEGTAGWPI